MSAPAKDESAPSEKKGLGKYVSRMKSVLKKSDGSKRFSFSGKSPAAAVTTTGPSNANEETTETKPEPTPAPAEAQPTESRSEVKKILRSQIDAERAKRLNERFKIKMEPQEWGFAQDKEAFRVEKPIRMRIHRTCHKCNTTFGSNKQCTNCQHMRCTKCPRYPTKKDKGKGKERPPGVMEVDHRYDPTIPEKPLTRPSKTGGQPVVYKKPMQRVRRTCHECSALFVAGNKICPGCSHQRCSDCPRDPAMKKKYPYGYPGDVPSANSKYYSCHQCTKVFPIQEEGTEPPECARCKHIKCERCPKATPRKVEPAPDPEVLKSIEAKLAAFNLRPSATAA